MKVLIGTPVHQSKDYCIERWLNNVRNLNYPADLFMVDNSIGLAYIEKVKSYCTKAGIKNYKITHIELPPQQEVFERVGRSREIIRDEILSSDYEAWFSWECDQIIPSNALSYLVKMMREGNYMMINHNGWRRGNPDVTLTDFGVSLIRRDCLERHSFMVDAASDPAKRGSWQSGEAWYKKQVLQGGGSIVEAYGLIEPIYHLDS